MKDRKPDTLYAEALKKRRAAKEGVKRKEKRIKKLLALASEGLIKQPITNWYSWRREKCPECASPAALKRELVGSVKYLCNYYYYHCDYCDYEYAEYGYDSVV